MPKKKTTVDAENNEPSTKRLTEFAQLIPIKEPGKSLILLPVDADENRKYAQFEAARYRAMIDEWMRVNEIKEIIPLQLKQVGEAIKIAAELAYLAYGDTAATKKPLDADSDIIKEAVAAGLSLATTLKDRREKKASIDAETEDVNG